MDTYKLYQVVFGNIVLSSCIFKHVELYKKNKRVDFYDSKSLKNYGEREYVQSIYYSGGVLEEGDFKEYYELKEIELDTYECMQGTVLPYGIEIVKFRQDGFYETTPLSELPISVHSVYNVLVYQECEIPTNIKKITFYNCPNISGRNDDTEDTTINNFIKLPNTLREVVFASDWENENYYLRPDDIPYGITKLDISNVVFEKGILPSSLTSLSTLYKIEDIQDQQFELPSTLHILELLLTGLITEEIMNNGIFFKILPQINLSTLKLSFHYNLLTSSQLFKCTTIKSLTLILYGENRIIQPDSLPPNLTSLILENTIITQPNTFPNTLTSLKIISNQFIITQELFNKMVSLLPSSVTTLILPKLIYDKYLGNLPIPIPQKINTTITL